MPNSNRLFSGDDKFLFWAYQNDNENSNAKREYYTTSNYVLPFIINNSAYSGDGYKRRQGVIVDGDTLPVLGRKNTANNGTTSTENVSWQGVKFTWKGRTFSARISQEVNSGKWTYAQPLNGTKVYSTDSDYKITETKKIFGKVLSDYFGVPYEPAV